MKFSRNMAAALVIATAGLSIHAAHAEQNALQRTDLVQNDISVPGHEVIQVRVDFRPGAVSINHSHPGEEVAYVLKGILEYQLEGGQPVTLKEGQSLFIPAGVAHVARNVGDGEASELATYIVEKGSPLVVPVK
uniref:cupin domain-containing protein n=1 Tax=uncultured Rhizobium sp. TaxID=155567 RepID=UPI002638BC6D|nr:cupin domain-containing protein [uncultured Rhizobium sp.]